MDNITRIFDIYFLNDQLGWFFSGGKCYHTEDGGNTWYLQAEQSYLAEIEALQFITQNLGWAGGYVGLIYTTDGGNSWTDVVPAGINMHVRGINFINSLQGWIVGDSGGNSYIIKTSDGGLTWEIQSFPSISQFYAKSVHFTDSNSGWVVGTHYPTGVILKTSNGGSTWELIDFPNSHNLYKISFFDENLGWVLGEGGTVVKTTNGGAVFVENENVKELTVDFDLSQNYPNPFNPTTKIRYEIPLLGGDERGGLVTLKVYDVLGNEVETLVNEVQPAGEYEVEFNGEELSSGIYFYQLKAGSFIQTKKMVLMK
ncbi:MAG: hypothetical protein A2W30_04585 [Ignavibacteria bacterium RBG_16_36_9]|nr:MAG: hypothetical protein A2W30_04585 [Ignavibacteria bacterium RBG_16_36_9]